MKDTETADWSEMAVRCFLIKENMGALVQHIIHTLVTATVLENVCHFRTQVSAIATHFLQTVVSTVHYMILLCQSPFFSL